MHIYCATVRIENVELRLLIEDVNLYAVFENSL